ncbi:hypothetical protein [Noviluteimonas dokdonensis]|uniref:hypothetical protein n=1 Tax=Noviluteimonas dokdonensis TaxID=414050 RepID=UPI001378F364|nr:hypothetical protein [Lysobacter dokdonensis]
MAELRECEHEWQPDADVAGAIYCPKCDVTRKERTPRKERELSWWEWPITKGKEGAGPL